MSRRTSNAPLLILALVVIFMFAGLFLGVFSFSFKRLLWGPLAGSHFLPAGVYGLFGFGALLQIALAFWVGIDANRRGMNGVLWGLLVLFTFVVGLLVYLIVVQTSGGTFTEVAPAAASEASAAASRAEACRQCGGQVEKGFRVCPFCGAALGRPCPHCSRPAESGWKVCPYCSTALEPAGE